MMKSSLFFILLFLQVLSLRSNKIAHLAKNKRLKCTVCEELVKFTANSLNTTQDFAYQVRWRQQEKEYINFAHSETHISEVLDHICEGSFNEIYDVDFKEDISGRMTLIPNNSSFEIKHEKNPLHHLLEDLCIEILDETEDHLIHYFSQEYPIEQIKNDICIERARVCPPIYDTQNDL